MRISAESVKKAVVEKCQDRERGKGCKSDEEGRVCIACLSYRQSARKWELVIKQRTTRYAGCCTGPGYQNKLQSSEVRKG